MSKRFIFPLIILVLLVGLAPAAAQEEAPAAPLLVENVPFDPSVLTDTAFLVTEILEERPHDSTSYTQGFLLHEGRLFESAGRTGASRLMEVDPETGDVLREVRLNEQIFAEGLALVEDRLVQLTWQTQIAYFWDIETFEPMGVYFYEGEGWGLCYDDEFLWMSNGSEFLQKRDSASFRLLEEIPVTIEGVPQIDLNELECVGDSIYANVYQTDYIIEIDKGDGTVISVIDATNLLTEDERAALQPGAEVLNGIAYDPENEVFLITGKHWTTMFEVRFVAPES